MKEMIRRVVTGHDKNGVAVALTDDVIKTEARAEGVGTALLWVTDETPADISGNKDRAKRKIGVPPPRKGSILRIVDFQPVRGEVKGDNAAMAKEMGIEKQLDHRFMYFI